MRPIARIPLPHLSHPLRNVNRQSYQLLSHRSSHSTSTPPPPPPTEPAPRQPLTPRADLSSHTCLVTGGAGAIGHAIAHSLASCGASVYLVGRTQTKLSASASRITSSLASARVHTIAGDVSSGAFWRDLMQRASLRDVSVLVNAAGVAQNGLLFKMDDDALRGIVDTNLMGTMLAAKYVAERMARSKTRGGEGPGKCIVNVGSMLGVRGGKGAVAYAASKAGIHGLTRALAEELAGFNIRVNAVEPGYIESDMTEGLPIHQMLHKIPAKRLGRPDEVADAIMFLITNAYANNCVVNLDGGLSANGAI